MGYELKVINNKGEALSLTDNNDYTVYKIEGLAPPKVTLNSSSNATQDGSVINSTRIESRNLVIYTTVNGDIEANRINLYKYFPPKKSVQVYFKNGLREVFIEGIVELIECDLFTNRQKAQISIICPRPYFMAVEDLVSNFSDISALFEFPFSIAAEGIEFSAITPNIRKSIIYAGDTETGIIIDLFVTAGTVVKPTIYDVFRRTKFTLNGTFNAGDLIRINSNQGEKSVTLYRNGGSLNGMGLLSADSDWLILEPGDNVFTYECEDGAGNLQITFKSTALYSGV